MGRALQVQEADKDGEMYSLFLAAWFVKMAVSVGIDGRASKFSFVCLFLLAALDIEPRISLLLDMCCVLALVFGTSLEEPHA